MINVRPFAAIAAALLCLAACDPEGETLVQPEMAAFDYSGDATGSFVASGPVPAYGAPWNRFAGAYRETDAYVVTAYVPTTGSRGNRLIIVTSGPLGTGTYSSDCDGEPTSRCLLAQVSLNMDHSTAGVDPGETVYVADHVTFAVQSVSASHIDAAFSGTFVSGTGRTLTVGNGRVELPLVPH
jgi:hypothetical protein